MIKILIHQSNFMHQEFPWRGVSCMGKCCFCAHPTKQQPQHSFLFLIFWKDKLPDQAITFLQGWHLKINQYRQRICKVLSKSKVWFFSFFHQLRRWFSFPQCCSRHIFFLQAFQLLWSHYRRFGCRAFWYYAIQEGRKLREPRDLNIWRLRKSMEVL